MLKLQSTALQIFLIYLKLKKYWNLQTPKKIPQKTKIKTKIKAKPTKQPNKQKENQSGSSNQKAGRGSVKEKHCFGQFAKQFWYFLTISNIHWFLHVNLLRKQYQLHEIKLEYSQFPLCPLAVCLFQLDT